jgi:hypothetical protein
MKFQICARFIVRRGFERPLSCGGVHTRGTKRTEAGKCNPPTAAVSFTDCVSPSLEVAEVASSAASELRSLRAEVKTTSAEYSNLPMLPTSPMPKPPRIGKLVFQLRHEGLARRPGRQTGGHTPSAPSLYWIPSNRTTNSSVTPAAIFLGSGTP